MTPFASTYRVQLHAGFDLAAARALAPYWRALGIDACYASPVFAAEPGSMHGYDVTNPTIVNPELGGRDAFDAFSGALRAEGLGLLLDIVPNHEAASTANPTWRAMLAGGEQSAAARTFDVDWAGNDGVEPGRLLWPMLGDDVEREIAAGHLRLERASTNGDGGSGWQLRYFDEVLPVVGPVDDANDVARVLDRQHYKLAQWRRGAIYRNYRRFFDVATLAGVRVEDEDVFHATHALVVEFVAQGAVNGLRIDHIDGLSNPAEYLDRLAGATGGLYTVVEKILAADESMPTEWAARGTTGYEVLNEILGLFIDPAGRAVLEERVLAENGGVRFPTVERAAKRQVLDELFAPEWERVRRALIDTVRAAGLRASDDEVADALAAVTVNMRVYRTYLIDDRARGEDRRRIEEALAGATGDGRIGADAIEIVGRILLGDDLPDAAAPARRALLRRWQQLGSPVFAKGHEDTACYRYPVLLAQAEVGGDPGEPATDAVARFHRRAAERSARNETGLVATSSHDTKRSEDVRARLAVLSERPSEFETALALWREATASGDDVTPEEERFVAQTLLGAWPLEGGDLGPFSERIAEYLRKALREAKQRTSWLDPDEQHEDAVIGFARRSIDDGGRAFLSVFAGLLDVVSFHGACNSLASLVVKLALPGVADFYQGSELWDLSLVDPDNRRPVDYTHRRTLLEALDGTTESVDRLCASLRLGWRSGALKMFVTSRGLRARRDDRELFTEGDYLPLPVVGRNAEHVVAFARRRDDRWAAAIVPRLTTRLTRPPLFPVGDDVWGDTAVVLPDGSPVDWRETLCGVTVASTQRRVLCSDALAMLPVALLVS